MADDNKVTLKIDSEFNDKGVKAAEKSLGEVTKETKKAQDAIEQNSEATSNFSLKAVAAWGAVAVGIKKVIDFAKDSVDAFLKNARSVNMLSAAYKAVGYNSDEAMRQAKAFASEMQNLTGIADEAFLDALRLLANYKVVGAQAQEAVRAAYSLSIAQGMSFETALMQIAKAAAGSTAALSRYGIVIGNNVKEGEKFDAVLAQINDKFGASAQAAMGDITAQVGALKESWGDFKEQIGQYLIPAFQELIKWGQKAVDVLNNVFSKEKTIDQIAYEKNLWRIAEINKEIAKQRDRLNSGWYNHDLAKRRIDELEKERALLQSAQKEISQQIDKQTTIAKQQDEQAKSQEKQINNARVLSLKADDRAKKEAEVTAKLKEQLETFKQNAQQSSNERRVRFTAEVAGADLSGLASIDVKLEQERELQQKLNEIKEQALQDNLAKAQEAADKETEIGQTRIAKALEQLDEFNVEKTILDDEYTANRETLNARIAQSSEALYNLEKLLNTQKVQDFSKGLNAMSQLQNSKNKELVAVGKAAGIAQATIDTAQGAIAAYQAMAHIPYVGPALGVAAAAALTAYGAERIAEIGGVKMAEGGLVKAVTGGVPAVVGEGGSDEAVLPLDNARAMQRIGGAIAEQGGSVGGVQVNINVAASGGVEAILEQLTEASRNGVVQALEFANLNYKVGAEQQGYSV